MLFHLFSWLSNTYDFPGSGLFNYISFRAALAIVLSLTVSVLFGKRLIGLLQQLGFSKRAVRVLSINDYEEAKINTPTGGGLIIISAIVIPTLLCADLTNIYVQLLLLTTLWMGALGFVDDRIKARAESKEYFPKHSTKRKGNSQSIGDSRGLKAQYDRLKEELTEKFKREKKELSEKCKAATSRAEISECKQKRKKLRKQFDHNFSELTHKYKGDAKGVKKRYRLIHQIVLGMVVSVTIALHPDITIRYRTTVEPTQVPTKTSTHSVEKKSKVIYHDVRGAQTTIPFIKNHEFDYRWLVPWDGEHHTKWVWLFYGIIITFIIVSVSNGANITDGLDGLAAGVSSSIGMALALFAYISGNIITADYLNVMYLPQVGELSVFSAAFIGSTIGFLWFNSYPAQVFMGDTGSLTIGGIIAVFAILIRKELLLPILCGVFLLENLSVIIQLIAKKYLGESRKPFLVAPIHHHYQKKGLHEAKIVSRFWLLSILLAVLTFMTLKLR